MTPIKMTETALAKIKQVMGDQGMPADKTYVRVGVRGQSCSGPVFAFGLDDEVNLELDDVLVQDGVNLVHEKQFAEVLEHVEIDFRQSPDGRQGFTFKNTNPLNLPITGGCGTCSNEGCKSE